ncbi:MAG: bifunctional glutamate N-acetyltransferase/amino-acid acetyltransferase ArgJ [Deltaproteobacteria bacterium]|nr:bifunctional glutamate N-acetyltransferase/amino-acid acetyltransferase ArgJ [Deltaproteobacteria bacterium]
MKRVDRGIAAVEGIKSAVAKTGIKKNGKLDLAVLFSDYPCLWCATFTKNNVKAAPVLYDIELLSKNKPLRAIVVNSGNANACTKEGKEAVTKVVEETSKILNIKKDNIAVCSTGIIGERLPYEKIISSLKNLDFSEENCHLAAEAILTTDTKTKEVAYEFEIDGEDAHIGGMAKGAGMINPHMATMLSFIVTDVNIERDLLCKALKEAVDFSFNRISVDGDTSTNDSCFLLSTCKGENSKIEEENEAYDIFLDVLKKLCMELALKIVGDGEGATKLVKIIVDKAKNGEEAERCARAIADSLLVKTALFGKKANWGRIAACVGYSGVTFSEQGFSISVGGKLVFDRGKENKIDISLYMKNKDIDIVVSLYSGNASYTMWTTDLSYDYVEINSI